MQLGVDMLLELYRHLVRTTCATVVVVSLVLRYDPSEEMASDAINGLLAGHRASRKS
jgi:hypothetical protein